MGDHQCSGKARQKGLSFVGVLLVTLDLANFHEICTAATYSGSLFIILPLNICITIIFITILSSPLTHNLYSELMTPTSHYAYPPTSYLPYHMPVLPPQFTIILSATIPKYSISFENVDELLTYPCVTNKWML